MELTDTQKYQLDFIKNSETNLQFCNIVSELDSLHINLSIEISEYKERLEKWIYENIKSPSVLSLGCEVILKDFFVKVVQDILSNFSIECYVSAGTTTKHKFFIDPIVQLYNWKGCGHHRNYEDDLFNPKYFSEINKDLKGILSINRKTQIRDYLDSKITFFDGYYNYVEKSKSLLSWQNHSKISKRSFVNFIVETDCFDLTVKNSNLSGNHFTEKTFLPILEESIIIVLGGYGFVESLENLGIKTWNSEFGFKDNESYKVRVDSFLKCIEYYNNLSFNQISEIYNKFKSDILSNKKLIENVIYS